MMMKMCNVSSHQSVLISRKLLVTGLHLLPVKINTVCAGRKDFDVYISYARNSEDESFVLSTLQCVLENHFGYSVCIFDRDSLPGGSEYQ